MDKLDGTTADDTINFSIRCNDGSVRLYGVMGKSWEWIVLSAAYTLFADASITDDRIIMDIWIDKDDGTTGPSQFYEVGVDKHRAMRTKALTGCERKADGSLHP
jgi:hypothetical protein